MVELFKALILEIEILFRGSNPHESVSTSFRRELIEPSARCIFFWSVEKSGGRQRKGKTTWLKPSETRNSVSVKKDS